MKHPIEAVIDKVSLKPNKIQPIIVDFQNGELKDDEAVNMECGLYCDNKVNRQLLALSNGQVVYKGYRPNPDEAPTYTMLAIHNRKTGKVRLVQAERWQVAPVLDKEPKGGKDVDDDKIALLNKQFGSKRVKRRTEQIERMKINVNSVTKQLEETVSNISIERTDLSLPSLHDESVANTNLPECNRNASDVQDVYNINDIVPLAKLETLYDAAKTVLNQEQEGKSKFFMETLKVLRTDDGCTVKIALLLYLEAVAAWLNMPIKDAKKRGIIICSESSDVNDYVIQTYSMRSAQGRQRPNSMRDKGIMHCLILGLTISNFTLDLNLFTTIIKNGAGIKKLGELARFVGAVPTKDNKNVVVLKLPLPPQLALAKKGKKKK
ncbi:uncharacterized protein LOC124186923 [Neodiprion fabricii]|uniref:uncharacterized protein LOC124186923 n=1 Tax=Neodiprion fabricii TaxID=2872261 RepID=UPI001ED95052|nr:uncharacterized protein LOC124186923 [Neodiprion fabricii]